jgi:catalase
VNYEPNSLGGGCPFQAGKAGFNSFPERFTTEDKVRGNPELFAEHYGQARLFFHSQTPAEQAHIANAFRFELTRVQTPAVRQRILALLANVDDALVAKVAEGLGMEVPAPLPRAFDGEVPDYIPSPALSLLSRPGETGIKTRRVAILVAPGVDGAQVNQLYAALLTDGAVPRLVGSMLGKVKAADGSALDVEISLEAGPSVMYDGMIVPDGAAAADALARNAHAIDFIREQYRHCKPILVLGGGANLLAKAMIPTVLPDGSVDPALLVDGTLDAFAAALAGHRAFVRETDPPMV